MDGGDGSHSQKDPVPPGKSSEGQRKTRRRGKRRGKRRGQQAIRDETGTHSEGRTKKTVTLTLGEYCHFVGLNLGASEQQQDFEDQCFHATKIVKILDPQDDESDEQRTFQLPSDFPAIKSITENFVLTGGLLSSPPPPRLFPINCSFILPQQRMEFFIRRCLKPQQWKRSWAWRMSESSKHTIK